MQGTQFQTTNDLVRDWPDAIAKFAPGTPVMAIDNVQLLSEAKARNPGVFTILRHWVGHQHFDDAPLAEVRVRARAFLVSFVDGTFMQHAHNVDAITDYNEYCDLQDVRPAQMAFLVSRGATFVGHNAQHYQQRLVWLQALYLEWAAMQAQHPALKHIRLVGVNAPPGNSIPVEYARIVAENGGMLGHHPYTAMANGVIRFDDDKWYSGRWRLDDEYYRSQGVFVEWIGTEAGPIYTAPAGNMGPDDGWRRTFVADGDWSKYDAALRYRRQLIQEWNTLRGNRYRGDALFVSGSVEGPWRSFELSTDELHKLAALTVAVPPVGNPAPPPPPPPPEPRTWEKAVFLLPQTATRAQYNAVADVAFPTRSEIAFSADSAFARPANVTVHRVIVYDAAGWGGQTALAAWVQQHYSYSPATVVEYRSWPPTGGGF